MMPPPAPVDDHPSRRGHFLGELGGLLIIGVGFGRTG